MLNLFKGIENIAIIIFEKGYLVIILSSEIVRYRCYKLQVG